VPDLPGCIATGAAVGETEQPIREAIELDLIGLREDGSAYSGAGWSRRIREGWSL